ncbi:ABC transporter substrate-binding protein [Alphaproteobacteria bacterium]|nr:ABC transporter substrate-binding protein [Alphaproteobacteria bacterium]
MNKKICAAVAAALCIAAFLYHGKKNDLPVIAIANYGPHSTLEASLNGLKKELADCGFIENKTIRYEIADVGFDPALIPQMITNLVGYKPKVMVTKSTPVSQFAKGKVHDIPLVYCDITDPMEVGLIKTKGQSHENVTGSSDQNDLEQFLNFAKELLPNAKTVGLLYSTSESNDAALVHLMEEATSSVGLSVLAIPVDQARDIPVRMQEFRNKADFIYVGMSGPIQPALPTIASEAQKMGIPVFNSGDQAVRDGLVLASFGANYESVGRNAGKLVVKLLKGADIKTLAPIYPGSCDHQCFINKKLADRFQIKIPKGSAIIIGE